MLGYQLNEQQKNQIEGQYYAPYEFFNCIKDINGLFFLVFSQQNIVTIASTQWVWVLTLPQAEYIPPPPPPPFPI
jgi:hypothetical protein